MRVEFFGDAIESIRRFNIETQRSDASVAAVDVVPWGEIPRDERFRRRILERFEGPESARRELTAFLSAQGDVPETWLPLAFEERATIFDYVPADAVSVLDEPAMISTVARALDQERTREQHVLLAAVESGELSVDETHVEEALLADIAAPHPTLDELGVAMRRHATLVIPGAIENPDLSGWVPRDASTPSFWNAGRPNISTARSTCSRAACAKRWPPARRPSSSAPRWRGRPICCGRPTCRSPIGSRPARPSSITEASRPVLRFRACACACWAIARSTAHRPSACRMRAVKEGVPVTLADLRVGDHVVHAVHGIGQYLGLRAETILGATQDYLDLKYAGSDRMLVPVTQMHQIAKYSAAEGQAPRLSKMGGADWARTKARVSESLAKIADGLVQLYAERELARGFAFGADTPWQVEMEEAFPYETTPDQQKAIDETKHNMETPRPMDRLVCGDVGYGKTEVAMRAAFKAVADKKQVAVLVPTTLLADQHYRTFGARFAGFPLRIEELSRFKSKARAEADSFARSPKARSTSSSARIACCRKTSPSPTSA